MFYRHIVTLNFGATPKCEREASPTMWESRGPVDFTSAKDRRELFRTPGQEELMLEKKTVGKTILPPTRVRETARTIQTFRKEMKNRGIHGETKVIEFALGGYSNLREKSQLGET